MNDERSACLAKARVELLTTPGCHLCARAREALSALSERLGEPWVERDLTEIGAADPLWWEQVPLVLVDGTVACYWHVDEAAVLAALGRG